jgi:uncharacterized membrane protein (UPF0127 family)
VEVGDERLTVAVAETSPQRRQGLRGLDELPDGIDGMLFVYSDPRSASFNMRTVGLDLDIWWFDESAELMGSASMSTCLEGGCVSYRSPGEIGWALETAAGVFDFVPGELLSFPDRAPG